MINTYPLLRPLLFSMDPEAAHDFSFAQLDRLERCGLLSRFIGEPLIKPVHVCGIAFRNPVGLAAGLDKDFKEFIMNFGAPDEDAAALFNSFPASLQSQALRKPDSSDHPGEAVISIKTNRGTSYAVFLEVFDLAKKAYFDVYSERVGLTSDEYRALTGDDEASKALQDKGKAGIPMAISIAEPDKVGGN